MAVNWYTVAYTINVYYIIHECGTGDRVPPGTPDELIR